MVYSYATRPCKTGNLERRSEIIASEASNRRSNEGSSQERVFQSYISGSETVRGLASSNRSFSSEPICSLSSFQNGDIEFNQTSTSERRLGYFPRFEGCIFSHLRPSSITTLSSVHFRRENVPVSSSAIWPLCKSICVHSSLEISFKSCSSPRYSSTCIPGRLVTTFSVRGPIMASQQKAPQDYSRSRLYSQLGEVRTSSSSGIHFPRCSIQAQTSINRPLSGQHCFSSTSLDQVVGSERSFSSPVILHSRSDGVYGQPPSTRESFQKTPPVGIQGEVVSRTGFVGRQDPFRAMVLQSSESLDGHGGYNGHVSSSSSFSPAPSFHRFESGGLGGSHGQSHGIGSLVPVFQTTAHQCPRDGSSLVGSQSFCGSCQGSFGVASYGQHNSGGLCEQTGGDSFPNLVQPGSRDCVMVHSEQSSHQGQIFTWETQRSSGLLVQEREYCSNRMVSQSKSSISDISHLGQASSRFICNSSEQEATAVCVSCPGSRSICNRCTESELAGNVGIRISSISPDSSLSQENSGGGMFSVPYCSSLGGTSMVPSTSVTSGSSCNSPSFEEGSAVSTHFQNVASHPSGVPSSRLVAMQRHLQATGISEPVASRIYSAKRPSTNNLYDYRWKSWVDWCIGRKMDPFNPSVNMFGEFLISLHDKNFSPATVKGYRSAISTTLKQISSIDFSSQSVLSDVVRSFELERPRTRPHFPKWDLAVVLSALNSSPFEPLDSCGFKELTFKTVFLTALASGRRRSEIHALSCSDVQFSDQSVSLSTFPGFLAKNQLPSVLSSPISLPSLSGQDSLLCPVRALKIYLERVLSRRKGRKRLFISHLDSYDKEISCDTISRWIVQTIKLAYGTRKLNQVSVNAHEVRALASSWAWSNKVPLDDIVKAGFWSSENSFIKFYLRDVSILASSLASLGPVVAAQAVVVPVTSVL